MSRTDLWGNVVLVLYYRRRERMSYHYYYYHLQSVFLENYDSESSSCNHVHPAKMSQQAVIDRCRRRRRQRADARPHVRLMTCTVETTR